MIIELDFVQHAEDGTSLGYVQFFCPVCNDIIVDYDHIWKTFTGHGRIENDFTRCQCNHCKANLEITKIEYDTFDVVVK